MNEKQQAKKENATETNSLPFEKELLSLIKMAMDNGYSQNQTSNLLKQYWKKNLPDLPVETEDEIAFREKVVRFMEVNYEKFDEYSYKHSFDSHTLWSHTDSPKRGMNAEIKRKFIYEVCCTIYKGFKMDTFDRNTLKKVNAERTKILFPDVRGHILLCNLILNQLLGYICNYEVEDGKKDELEKYLSKFELEGKDDKNLAKFMWLLENFD